MRSLAKSTLTIAIAVVLAVGVTSLPGRAADGSKALSPSTLLCAERRVAKQLIYKDLYVKNPMKVSNQAVTLISKVIATGYL